MVKKTHMNARKFEALQYLPQICHKIFKATLQILTGIKSYITSAGKINGWAGSSPDLAEQRRRWPSQRPKSEAKGYGVFFLAASRAEARGSELEHGEVDAGGSGEPETKRACLLGSVRRGDLRGARMAANGGLSSS